MALLRFHHVGFTATTDDEHPTMPTDGELSETRWVTRDELLDNTLPLPGPGSPGSKPYS